MKPKTMVLMVIAIVCGLGASYMTSRLLAERNNEKEEIPKVSVVVAKKGLNVGIAIKKPQDLFEMKDFTKGQEPKDAFTTFDQLKGKYLKRNLRKGDFVTPKDIDDNQIALELPKGMVAVGIRMTAENSASGFAASPGSRVNIIWTIRGGNQVVSQSATLLENVLVVAADTQSQRSEEKGAILAQVVTVALTPADALAVKLAQQHGDLSLVLRNMDDESEFKTAKLTFPELMKKLGKDENGNELKNPEPEAPKVEAPKVQPVPQPVAPPKPAKVLPKFEKHVVLVREGKNAYTRVFWFDEQGQPIPEEVGREYEKEAQAAAETQAPPAPVPPAGAGNPPAPTSPNASGPQQPRPEGGEKQSPQQRPEA
jgi:pilus assembly protein CpaB